jgi:hypothetical protein
VSTIRSKYLLFILCMFACFTTRTHAGCFTNPLYAGPILGYGSTTWQYLVPKTSKQNTISISTPKSVTEGGVAWGFLAGYEYSPYFAIEGNYIRYPNASILFNNPSLYTVEHNGVQKLSTHSEMASVMGKIMMIVPQTSVRAFSSFGAAVIHRWDSVNDHRRATLAFGIGFNHDFTDRIMAEVAGGFTPGYGEAELEPVDNYVPFLYSITFRLAYRMGV